MPRDLKDLYPQPKRILLDRKAPAKKRRRPVISLASGLTLVGVIILTAAFNHDQDSPGAQYEADSLELALAVNSLADLVYRPLLAPPCGPEAGCEGRRSSDKVKRGDTFETVLVRNGIDRGLMPTIMDAARGIYNLNRVVIGRKFEFKFADSLLAGVEYEIDEDRSLLVTLEDSASWNAEIVQTEYQVLERGLSGTISSSLYETVMDLCGLPELALKLSEVYAWQIDFHSEIRKGDTFKVIYEEKIHPGGAKKVGRIVAGVFNNRGQNFYAIGFTNANGRKDYFDLEGKSLRRAFLRSPFKYMPRISSRYSRRRFHPILKIYRPHLGIDYAAPTGTPVLALGDGRVDYCGRNGGFGKYIKVKHNGMYTTSYGHLSGYARGLKVGTRVRQGQVIGYVGSTGLATGPHLDFRFYKNSNPVDPLKVDIPAGDPVDSSLFSYFSVHREQMARRLEAIGGNPLIAPGVITLETGEPQVPDPASAASE
ncbi:MAG: M23 family metallopeptidase [Candidatus Glassbacteria bacterium]|nr:M23 family metallopeptidase [Candidatus Glassbacteria bacterium]